MENMLARVTPAALQGYKKPCFIRALKSYKDTNVCYYGHRCTMGNMCKGCRSLSAVMCRRYHASHGGNAGKRSAAVSVDELAMRLAYEVIFDIIPIKSLEDGTWLDARYRDSGHTMRMRIVWSRARSQVSKYPWISVPR